MVFSLVHARNEVVDQFSAVTSITTFREVSALVSVTTERGRELKRPEEVISLLEAWSASDDLVDEVLHAGDTLATKVLSNDLVARKRNTLLVNLAETALVDQAAHSLKARGTICDVRLNNLKHVQGGLVGTNEHTIVDLTKTEQLENLLGLGGHAVDTTNTDYKKNFGFCRLVEVAVVLGLATQANEVVLSGLVFTSILASIAKSDLASESGSLQSLGAGGSTRGGDSLGSFLLLEHSFRNVHALDGSGNNLGGGLHGGGLGGFTTRALSTALLASGLGGLGFSFTRHQC
jgi:hypothetical protein